MGSIRAVFAVAAVALITGALCSEVRAQASEPETKMVIAGRPDYDKSGFYRFNFGHGYRDEWTTPFPAPILRLSTFAGGLTAVRQVGSFQSIGLALKGADGFSYTFRTLDKDPTRVLPEEWRTSIPAQIVQDQTSAANPAGLIIVASLAEAVGLPHTNPQLVYMPKDPSLGQFLETFGDKAGSIDLYPQPAEDGRPGFMGATEIVSTGTLWKQHLEGTAEVDKTALVYARVFDLFLGDWDRHFGQWRWMKIPGHDGYQPLPEDRDQAFADYSGTLMYFARTALPKFVAWRDDYENVKGLLLQGRDVDDWLLNGLPRSAYIDAAKRLQERLTDQAIETAVRRMPPEWFAIDGAQFIADLKNRRELLPGAAEVFYESSAKYVNVHGTNKDDVARLTREADGSATLEISFAGADGSPGPAYFSRHFLEDETKELRIYLYDGNDRFTATGPRGGIKVRLSAAGGKDRLDDSRSGGTRFYDVEEPSEVVKGKGTKSSNLEWTRVPLKEGTPWLEKVDFGSLRLIQPLVWWEPDPGFVLAVGATRYNYGYRKQPYASLQTVFAQYKTKRTAFAVSYSGDFRWSRPGLTTFIQASADGAENYNFFGFGNETSAELDDGDFFEADQQVFTLFTAIGYENERRTFRVAVGPEGKFSKDASEEGTFISTTQPYGFGDFGQLGAKVIFEADTHGRALAGMGIAGVATPEDVLSDTGLKFSLEGRVYSEGWDVEETFGTVSGALTGHLQLSKRLTLGARVGGQSVFGRYPWAEAAFLGHSKNLRGYDRNRFAGDSSVFGNLQAMVGLFNLNFILPLRVGVLGLADAGRVFLEDEDSDKWHPAVGGGVYVRIFPTRAIFSGILAGGDEGVRVYVNVGYGI